MSSVPDVPIRFPFSVTAPVSKAIDPTGLLISKLLNVELDMVWVPAPLNTRLTPFPI